MFPEDELCLFGQWISFFSHPQVKISTLQKISHETLCRCVESVQAEGVKVLDFIEPKLFLFLTPATRSRLEELLLLTFNYDSY